jgi:tRNA pseudouridine65 synthase
LPSELIIHREASFLAVNKPAGIPVHGSRILPGRPETLLSLVRKESGTIAHVVHRLDRPVSGVMLFALEKTALTELGRSFELRRARKTYLAVVRGWVDDSGLIDHPLAPPRDERHAGSPRREAVTRYRSIARAEVPVPVSRYPAARYSLVALEPLTGRRHQLRRHMKHVSHHLVGDTSYGRGEHNRLFRERFGCDRLLLHAWSLGIPHPGNARWMRFEAPLDATFHKVVDALGWSRALADFKEIQRLEPAPEVRSAS